jgi:hypothetical protein
MELYAAVLYPLCVVLVFKLLYMELRWDKKNTSSVSIRTLTNTGTETDLPLPIHYFHYTSFFRIVSTNLQTVKY